MFSVGPSTNPLWLMYMLQQQNQNGQQSQGIDPMQLAMLSQYGNQGLSPNVSTASQGLFPNYDKSPGGQLFGHWGQQNLPGPSLSGDPGYSSSSGILGLLHNILSGLG